MNQRIEITEPEILLPEVDASLEGENRLLRAYKALNMDERERLVYTTLLMDPAPWRVQTLSEWTGYSRAAVRNNMNDLLLMGWAVRDPDTGWTLTEEGRECILRIRAQCFEIAWGGRRRFSECLCECVEKHNRLPLLRKWSIPRDTVF